MRKLKINMNADRNAKDIVTDLKMKLGENSLSQSQRSKREELNLYLFKMNAKT